MTVYEYFTHWLITSKISLTAFAIVAALSACDSGQEQSAEITRVGETRFQTPQVLREVAKLDADQLILEVLVNDQVTVLQRGEDNIWSGVVDVPANRSSSVAVRWGQNYGNAGYIALAEQRKSVFSGPEGNTVTFDGGYDLSLIHI